MYEIEEMYDEGMKEVERRQRRIDEREDREINNVLIDNFGRIAKKLRISVTESAICVACIACQEGRLHGLMNMIDWIIMRSPDLLLF
jgi:hypothetical protein